MDMIGYIVGGAAIGGLASFAGGATGSALGSIANAGFLGGALASGSSAAAGDWASEIWTDFGDRMWNAIKIDLGQFAFNPDVSFGENVLSVLSRFVWETPHMILGNGFSHLRNNFDKVDVSFRNGSTVVNVDNERNISWGMTLGPYINGENIYEAKDMFEHEYGHTIQSRIIGPFFLAVVAIPSFIGQGIENINPSGHEHGREWYEVWSNQLSYGYYKEHGYTEIVDGWRNDYLLEQDLGWYFSATAVYYTLLAFAAAIFIF